MDSAARQKLDPAQRLRMLEDAEEIRWMKAYYAQVCDDKFGANHVAKAQDEIDAAVRPMVERVFAPDAIWGARPMVRRRSRGGRQSSSGCVSAPGPSRCITT
jgi:hypothetical protein